MVFIMVVMKRMDESLNGSMYLVNSICFRFFISLIFLEVLERFGVIMLVFFIVVMIMVNRVLVVMNEVIFISIELCGLFFLFRFSNISIKRNNIMMVLVYMMMFIMVMNCVFMRI